MLDNISIGSARLQFRVKKNEDDIAVLFRLSKKVRVPVNPSHWTYQYDKPRILRLREQGFVRTPDGKGFGAIERNGENKMPVNISK
jgi:hypothetical protein